MHRWNCQVDDAGAIVMAASGRWMGLSRVISAEGSAQIESFISSEKASVLRCRHCVAGRSALPATRSYLIHCKSQQSDAGCTTYLTHNEHLYRHVISVFYSHLYTPGSPSSSRLAYCMHVSSILFLTIYCLRQQRC